MKSCKNLVLSLLTVALVLLCVFALPQTAHAANESDLTFSFNKDGTIAYVGGCNPSASGELILPATYQDVPIGGIDASGFRGYEGLTSVIIRKNIKVINENAFHDCVNLAKIALPDSITYIANFAFNNCSSLQSVIFCGTQAQWDTVQIGSWNDALLNAQLQFHDMEDGVCAICGYDEFAEPDALTFTLNETEDGYIVSDCDEFVAGELEIPATYNSLPVVAIGDSAFMCCDRLTKVIIPEGVISIGDSAYFDCDRLVSVIIPDSVASIGGHVFANCQSLTDVRIPSKVTIVRDNTFNNCRSMTSITIPDSVTSIGTYAFYYCTSLTSVTIPDSVTAIGDSAFETCTSLTNVTYCGTQEQWEAIEIGEYNDPLTNAILQFHDMEDGACTICGYGESSAPSVLTFTLNETGDGYIVSGCDISVTGEVEIPATYNGLPVTSIGDYAFSGCYSLTSVIIGSSVTTIGEGVFNDCGRLTSVTIPNGVTTIRDYTFYYCIGLANVIIPNSVTTISSNAFYECNSLTKAVYCGTQEQWDAIEIGDWNDPLTAAELQFHDMEDGVCTICGYSESSAPSVLTFTLNETGDGYIVSDCDTSATGEVEIPATYNGLPVTAIGDMAFSLCYSLANITIPESVTTIGQYAFSSCASLTSITIPDNVISIGARAFAWCSGLTSITIPDKVITIADSTFEGCFGLISIDITGSVTSIGEYAFYNCTSLTNVIYCGTQEQWEAIEIGEYNDPLTNAILQFHNMENNACAICGAKRPAGDIDGNFVVNYDDAVCLLLNTLFGEAEYPLNGANGDVDGDGTVDYEDAVYLLLHVMFGETFYPLKKS